MAMKMDVHFYGRSDAGAVYDVVIDDDSLETWVTRSPQKVGKWIRRTENWNRRRLRRLIIGLNTEWDPYADSGHENPVAILNLFVGKCCLIYELHKGDTISEDLKRFFKDPNYTFVGLGIENDRQKLYTDFSMEICKSADLREMAAHELVDPELKKAGLQRLTKKILQKHLDYNQLLKIRNSDWQKAYMSTAQVIKGCLHSYLAFEIGRQLFSWYD